ncbi:MAG: molecular chaperone TorD family protein [Desulfobulbaceae bacterium]
MSDAASRALRRSNCYKLLAACFYEPDRDLFLEENLCDNLVNELTACGCDKAAAAAREMGDALRSASGDDLTVEHARLFVGPFELLAPPYGSVYMEKGRRIMGDTTMEVKRIYREEGLSIEVEEVPDHIILELEFLHYLSFREAETLAGGDMDGARDLRERCNDFLERYLLPWMSGFCGDIRAGAENRFYSALADCLESFSVQESARQHVAETV